MAALHHAIAVVGAGPRGTSVLERLCASVPRRLGPDDRLTVHVVDPEPPGAGRVWRTDQPGELLMNTVASQVTLFTDATVTADGPIRPGPSLHEWYASGAPGADGDATPHTRPLGPDDYPTRRLYGAYLRWVFAEVLRRAPESVTVRTHAARAVRLADEIPGERAAQRLELSDGTRLTGLAAVVLAQGHLPAVPSRPERELAAHARRHGLQYLPPANPADLTTELDALAPGQPVLLRGLGLNFFDHLALLTGGRGGTFVREGAGEDGVREGGAPAALRYLPSGKEPRLYAGSRRGVPYHARGDNEKGAHGRHDPLLLTPETIARLRARADAGDPPDFRAEVWPLVAKEVETVYYEGLLAARAPDGAPCPGAGPDGFRARFLATAHRGAEEAAVLAAFGIPDDARWCWDSVQAPHAGRVFTGPDGFHSWLLDRLREDVAHARAGNVRGPVKAALDVLRDLRNELRQIVDHMGLGGPSRRDHLDHWYTPLNAFLSIGPPRRRIEEMAALIEAGVLTVLGPGTEVRADDAAGVFHAHSPAVPDSAVTVTALVEARLPEPDVRRTADPLLTALLRAGECRPHALDGYETGGLDVSGRPYRLLDRQGRPHARRFAVGVPTEGVHWVTAAGARPGVNSVTLTDTDAVACAALDTLRPTTGAARAAATATAPVPGPRTPLGSGTPAPAP
ncbi:FAD/NAD(P)-binding protein [Streptomyces sp. Z26]|uniref:FAD/NAD(P)-binding protein n=1 Tax=Streptomyces sp. Z26 TaxID=2500177 RepID=UPI000EF1751D|nr:FAD/NAD(P)-binding protein [Streptomyces sp. Z26]RLL66596.1 FAD-binding protein [Streptomyces sp. Z26]